MTFFACKEAHMNVSYIKSRMTYLRDICQEAYMTFFLVKSCSKFSGIRRAEMHVKVT